MKNKIEKLKKELTSMTNNFNDALELNNDILKSSQKLRKAIKLLLPIVNEECIVELLNELDILREEKNELEKKVRYFSSKKGRSFMDRAEKVGYVEALFELGDFKEEKND